MADSASEMLCKVESVLDGLSLSADGFVHRVLRAIQMDARNNGLRNDGWTFSEERLREIAGRDSGKLPRLLVQLAKRRVNLALPVPGGYRFPKLERIVERRRQVANAVGKVRQGLPNPSEGIMKSQGNPDVIPFPLPAPSPALSPAPSLSPTPPIPIPTPKPTPIPTPPHAAAGERADAESPRQARSRKSSTHVSTVTPDDLPETIRTSAVVAALGRWVEFRAQRKPKVTTLSFEEQIEKLAKWGPERAIAAIKFSIAQGWQGIFEPKAERNTPNGIPAKRSGEFPQPDRPLPRLGAKAEH